MELLKASSILFVLLNPFLISIYLISLIRDLSLKDFSKVMMRAHIISAIVFVIFALAGESIFEEVFNVRFGAFLIFGGIIFLWIGVQSIFSGKVVLIETRGDPEHIAGSIAMPFMIAPGTISASVLIGSQLPAASAAAAIIAAISFSLVSIIVFKLIHDPLKKRNERLLNRYVEVMGRVVALFTGTFAIEMIAKGVGMLWPS
ncbi:MarC family protein [Teredinibacter purpureus]|uniref:MarC family protein n=1 Tax=Teredinibacter purpureus TaxID=2731756 RepID=UPI0005F7D5AC|nr:MarC family protein [Teredinibacter purpureus]